MRVIEHYIDIMLSNLTVCFFFFMPTNSAISPIYHYNIDS